METIAIVIVSGIVGLCLGFVVAAFAASAKISDMKSELLQVEAWEQSYSLYLEEQAESLRKEIDHKANVIDEYISERIQNGNHIDRLERRMTSQDKIIDTMVKKEHVITVALNTVVKMLEDFVAREHTPTVEDLRTMNDSLAAVQDDYDRALKEAEARPATMQDNQSDAVYIQHFDPLLEALFDEEDFGPMD